MEFKEKLQKIQCELKAPKNLYNSFGKYKYRNAEGICEAVKPMLEKYKVILTLSDDIIQVGERYYIKSTVSLKDVGSDGFIDITAMARESLDKKGMDESQITGTASSYARKYALNGLFLLDDTKDADSDEYHNQTKKDDQQKEPEKYDRVPTEDFNSAGIINDAQKTSLRAVLKSLGLDEKKVFPEIKDLNLTNEQFGVAMQQLRERKEKEKKEGK